MPGLISFAEIFLKLSLKTAEGYLIIGTALKYIQRKLPTFRFQKKPPEDSFVVCACF